MASSARTRESTKSLIPPTPESNGTTSPRSPPPTDKDTEMKIGSPEPPPVVPQKRKAGRKPLYKTAQERRDRNRRAQLAFRSRRSEYLATLEETCRSLQNIVLELQESNRTTNDALTRERLRVKQLERAIRNLSSSNSPSQMVHQRSMSFPQPTALPITADNNSPALQAVSSQSFPHEFSLITFEQQFSPSTSNILSPSTLNSSSYNQNNLGMLPLPHT